MKKKHEGGAALIFILGTRAQLIKMAPVMLAAQSKNVPFRLVFFAQHRKTMMEMLDMFGLPRPHVLVAQRQRDITSTASMVLWSLQALLEGLVKLTRLKRELADAVCLVHGDAPPVFIGALLARFVGYRIAHVEAGLRSFDFRNPFPEELTRVMTWELGLIDFYYCQDARALANVDKYGGLKWNISANTLIDALNYVRCHEGRFDVPIPSEPYGIVTIHRFETISDNEMLQKVVNIVTEQSYSTRLLFILHPPTERALKESGYIQVLEKNPRVELRPRYVYGDFAKLLLHAEFLISDGGSNQEECAFLGKPCLLLRKSTERRDGIGRNVLLSGFDQTKIQDFFGRIETFRYAPAFLKSSPSEMIVNSLSAANAVEAGCR